MFYLQHTDIQVVNILEVLHDLVCFGVLLICVASIMILCVEVYSSMVLVYLSIENSI